MTLLTLVLLALLGLLLMLGIAFGGRWRQGAKAPALAVVVVVLLAATLAVLVGVGLIDTVTEGRGSPEESAPWLILAAAFAAGIYLRHRLGKAAAMSAPAAPRAAPVAPEPAARERLSPAPGHGIFLSYRRADSADVSGRLYDRLAAHFGAGAVFKDVDSMALGVDFRRQIDEAVGRCRVLLAVIGRQWHGADATSDRLQDPRDFVRLELEAAIARGIPVLPVLVAAAALPPPETLPPTLRELVWRQSIALRPDPDFHADVDRLIRGIEAHLASGP